MKKIIPFLLAALTVAATFVSCDDKTGGKTLTLSPDKTAVTADGSDAVTFTVKYGDDIITGAKIINETAGTELSGASFATVTAGTYTFHAEFDGGQSAAVTVTATEPEAPEYGDLVLTVDKTTIKADNEDAATFTVTYEGKDVTSDCQVCTLAGMCLTSNVFVYDETGEYEFYATYSETPGLKSNTVTITVIEPEDPELTLMADKDAVPAAAGQKVTFTVMYGPDDVTSSARIVNQRTGNDISGNSFITTDNRKDTFIAIYDGGSSAPVEILKEVPGEFYKRIGVWRFTGVWCSYCYPAGQSIDKIVAQYPDRVVHMAVHGSTSGSPDPMTTDDGNALMSSIGIRGFPTLMYDYRTNVVGWYTDEYDLEKCEDAMDYPAECGIAVESSLNGNTVTADVTLWSGSSEEYFVNVVVLEDGIVADQLTPEGTYVENYVHNNTVKKLSSTKYGGASWDEIIMNDQKTERFTFDLSDCNAANCRLAVFVSVKTGQGNNKVGSNSVNCPLNGSVDFRFE